jgi:hypothetical protein
MGHQAQALGVSSAFVSAMETGSKAIPTGYVDKISAWLKLSADELARLKEAANGSARVVKIQTTDPDRAKLVAELKESVENLSAKQIRELRLIINNGTR